MKWTQNQRINITERKREREWAKHRIRPGRRKRSSKERITRPKRRKFIIWNRGILTSYLFLCVRHARLALTNLKLIGNSFHTLRGNFKIFGNLFGTLCAVARGICAFFYFVTKLSSCFSHRDRICWILVFSLSFSLFLCFPVACRHLIYSLGLCRSWALFGCFRSVINRICQLNAGAGAACVTLQNTL